MGGDMKRNKGSASNTSPPLGPQPQAEERLTFTYLRISFPKRIQESSP
jgi:hypothetical protein